VRFVLFQVRTFFFFNWRSRYLDEKDGFVDHNIIVLVDLLIDVAESKHRRSLATLVIFVRNYTCFHLSKIGVIAGLFA